MHDLAAKYSVYHPLITPELFLPPSSFDGKVKALAVYHDCSLVPEILYDTPSAVINYVLGPDSFTQIMHLHPHYHMYVENLAKILNYPVNPVATEIFRFCASTVYGQPSLEVIHGPALFFSSLSPHTYSFDGHDYSVPYELVEQSVRIYSRYAK